MRNKMLFLWCLLTAVLGLLSCEKMVVDGSESAAGDGATLVLRVAGFDVVPFDVRSGGADVASYCTRLNFVVYSGGKKVKAVNQTVEKDADFGLVSVKLDEGTYQLLVVAHSSSGNPTLATPEKVQFTNADGFTDTFYYYGVITVDGTGQTVDLTLQRAVAMFRFITTDGKPEAVRSVRFYYTGGSGALNAVTGFGCVNSQQSVQFGLDDVPDGQPLRLEVYTFPHAQTGQLKVQVTAYDAALNIVKERTFSDVPIELNRVTQYTGAFFTSDDPGNDPDPGQGADDAYTLRLNADWASVLEYGF